MLTYQISRRRLSLDGGPAIRTSSLRSSSAEPLGKALGQIRGGFSTEDEQRFEGVATHGVTEGVSACQAKGLVKGSDADSTLQAGSNVIHMPLKRIDKL